MASRISLSLTLIIVPPDSRIASTALFQFRGTPTAMLSAMERGSTGSSGFPLKKAAVTGAAPADWTPIEMDLDAILMQFAEGLQAKRLERQPAADEEPRIAAQKSGTLR